LPISDWRLPISDWRIENEVGSSEKKERPVKPHRWLIALIGVVVPRRLRADWKQEWEAELRYRELLLADWEKLNWKGKFDLLRRSLGAFWDALLLQPRRLEDEMFQDLRYGLRMLVKNPGFTFVVVLTLALGIGATTAIFSVVDAVLLRPLPFPESERLVYLREVNSSGDAMGVAEPNFADVEAGSQSFVALGHVGGGNLVVTGGSEAVRTRVSYASRRIFEVLGVQPIAGRTFLLEETKYPGPGAVLVSYGFWQRLLGGRADFSAVRLNVDGVSCAVVGVMPPSFNFPAETEVWVTRSIEPPNTSRAAHSLGAIGRLRPGVRIEEARAELSAIAEQLRQTHGTAMDAVDFTLIPAQQYLTRNSRENLWLFAGAVAMLLLVACANVSNLLLARYITRQREFTVRAALGAQRWRLARQLVIENLLVTLPAAALGALLARTGVTMLLQLDQRNLPRVNVIAVDGRVLVFACGLALLIAVALGLLPALRFARAELPNRLRESGRGQPAGGRLRGALVAVQISLTLVLLTGAGLLGRSFLRLWQVDPGFKTGSAVAMTLALPSTITPEEDEQLRQFYVQLLERLGQLPGVAAVGGIASLPLTGPGASGTFLIDNDPARRGQAGYAPASAGYFAAMGIPLLRGRLFDRSDMVNSPHVAIISQSLAQRYWPNEDPLGKRIQFGNMDTDKRLLHVVGVVGDVRNTLDTEAGPMVYAYSLQRPQWWQVSSLSIVVRASTHPPALILAMRAAVAALRPDVPLRFRTLDQVFSSTLDQRRFILAIFGVFAVVALLIAAIGIYGVMAYTVTQRTHEIGIRLALGAQTRDVLKLVIGQGVKLALSGIVLGLGGAWALTRLMTTLLFSVSTTDPPTFIMVTLLLTGVALLACYLPARRATKVDPMIALRHD
jgi:putative ABC transport system permease protein